MKDEKAKNQAPQILYGIKRDTGAILDLFVTGAPRSAGGAKARHRASLRAFKPSSSGSASKTAAPAAPASVKIEVEVKPQSARSKATSNKRPRAGQAGISDSASEQIQIAETLPPAKSKKRDTRGRFQSRDGMSKSQQAIYDMKGDRDIQNDGHPNSAVSKKTDTFLSKLLSASVEIAKNQNAMEAVGLATMGPVAGAVSEMVNLGSSVKDTAVSVVEKFRGEKKSDNPAVEAQIEATEEVIEAVEVSDKNQEKRNKKLIKAIDKRQSIDAKIVSSAKKQSKPGKVSGALKNAATSGGSGWVSGLLGGGAAVAIPAILSAVTAALPVIVAVVVAAIAAYGIKKIYDVISASDDTQDARNAMGLKDGEKASFMQKFKYSARDLLGIEQPGQKPAAKYIKNPDGSITARGKIKGGAYSEDGGRLGWLSRSEEAKNAWDIGHDKKGDSYGTYQMHSSGTAGDFVKQSPWAEDFKNLKPGTPQFAAAWQKAAYENGDAFTDAEDKYITQTHFNPLAEAADKMGVDINDPKIRESILRQPFNMVLKAVKGF